MKSSWISFVALEAALLLLVGSVAPTHAAKRKKQDPADLTNFLLSPNYSQWLVGPIARIATNEERDAYLKIEVDEDAAAFIEEFWKKRGGDSVFPTQGQKVIFDERVAEADRIFDEITYRGHRTDRGTIFVLYGEPEEIRFEEAPRGRGDFLEIWQYPREAEEGLDGKKPERLYYFVKKDGKTTLYRGPTNRNRLRSNIRN